MRMRSSMKDKTPLTDKHKVQNEIWLLWLQYIDNPCNQALSGHDGNELIKINITILLY